MVGPAEADIDFDIIKNDNDTFTVKYTPPGAGRYTIMVLFANQVPYAWVLVVTGGCTPHPAPAHISVSSLRGSRLGTILQPLIAHFLCVGSVPQRKQRALFQRLLVSTLTKLFLSPGDPCQPLPYQGGPIPRCQQGQG